VESHLKPGLQRWLDTLFNCLTQDELTAALAMQRHVGDVHSRAQISIPLVARGFRILKHEISNHLFAAQLAHDILFSAVVYVDHLIDVAFEEMSVAFIQSSERSVRTDEAYRLLAVGQDLALEREKQAVAVLEWEARFYRLLATGAIFDDLPKLGDSEFGLWFYHKAPLLFEGSSELEQIGACVQQIDETFFPQLALGRDKNLQSDANRALSKAILTAVDEIKFLLRSLFDRMVDVAGGRDVLTHLFNRRFLPSVLKREIALTRRSNKSFCVMMIDIDHFKQVNDAHGHETGDRVLHHVATHLMSLVRSGDFIFRYGGEEFLAVLTTIDARRALAIAENLRETVAALEIPLRTEQAIRVTISIGVAMSDDHPDYQYLIDRADRALYQAKEAGRNRVVSA
jgi:diguanylate cyclase